MTALPLPGGNLPRRRQTVVGNRLLDRNANHGLIFNKFVDSWSLVDDKYDLHQSKKDWLACFSGKEKKAGDAGACKQMCRRMENIAAQSIRNTMGRAPLPEESPRNFHSTSRFATGLGLAHPVENGFLWHHTLGVPYIPGSSIKGMIRAWAYTWCGLEEDPTVTRLFGGKKKVGALVVFDALPVGPVELVTEVLTPHDGGWRLKGPVSTRSGPLAPSDWHDPVPVFYLAVEAGAVFRFTLGATRTAQGTEHDTKSDIALGYELLAMALEWIGLGAKTAVGFGRFESESSRGPAPGDRVRIGAAHPKEKQRDKVGVIEIINENLGYATVKLDGGGKGSNASVKLTDLTRVSE